MSKLALPIAGAIAIGVVIAVVIVFWDKPEAPRPALPEQANTIPGSTPGSTSPEPAPGKPDTAPSEPLPQVAEVDVPPVSEARVPENSLRPKMEGPHADPKDGDLARRLIAEIRSGKTPFNPEALHTQAGQLRESGKLVDAHLLEFFSAREGYGPSALSLAEAYDPVIYQSGRSIMDEPDAAQAYKWYRKASEAGVDAADKRLVELHRWLEQAAKNGNPEFTLLLGQWK